ncbi:MAG TPA: nicotinamide riboside transporter PnuC [Saprospirales bacterium]|nr:nicotinamide riboside transporter PnuC [Saprospirales bacterium]HAY71932.1 nicotinamide riboside transporter PnuC [Saprospirales bacterium]HRQ28437.1 nicotinamide riboside transporter PnuC [Saprospiraceae bacterium]
MQFFIDFFLEPYRNSTFGYILLELIAAIFGVISVIYAKKEHILVYPTGIISTGIYIYLLAIWNLYGDMIINIYYTLMSIYGWYRWSGFQSDQTSPLKISTTGFMDKLRTVGIFVFTSLFVIWVYLQYEVIEVMSMSGTLRYVSDQLHQGQIENLRNITPYMDTFTTGVFFAAMWLMANKKLENWGFWIAGNIVSIPLYFVKGYGFTGIQYVIFLVLAIQGYLIWRKKMKAAS